MAMTINTTVGTEVEGFRITDALQNKLFSTLNEFETARSTQDLLENYYTLIVQIVDSSTAEQARLYVQSNMTRIQ